ncbi:prepilin peptidase [bacterium]|nr:MAG: prepilin peptidase [bacterium]
MEHVVTGAMIAIIGLMIGSFCGASVWRLRARQLIEDKAAGEVVDKTELKLLKNIARKSAAEDRSQCLYCGHQLAWYDLLPVVSWLQLKGKCRYCHKPIGFFEIIIEFATAIIFVISYLAWPTALDSTLSVTQFVLWLMSLTGLIILFCYDLRWYLLPNRVMFPVIGVASVYALVRVVTSPDVTASAISLAFSITILSGLYYALYMLSKGAWVGFGDIKLGLALALLVGEWQLAFLVLFLANVIGCIIVLPLLALKKLDRHSRVPFGPMLIAAGWIASLWGGALIDWYLSVAFLS